MFIKANKSDKRTKIVIEFGSFFYKIEMTNIKKIKWASFYEIFKFEKLKIMETVFVIRIIW